MRKIALLFAFTLCLSALGADLTGKWKVIIRDSGGPKIKAELTLKQEGASLTGAVSSPQGAIALENVEFKDGVLTCKLDFSGIAAAVKMTLEDDKLAGNYTTGDGYSGTVEAERKPGTAPAATPVVSPLAGAWKLTTTDPDGSLLKLLLTLKHDGAAWDGQLVFEDVGLTVPLGDIHVDGAGFTCSVPTGDGTYTVAARVAGGKLEGTSTGPDGTKNKIAGTR